MLNLSNGDAYDPLIDETHRNLEKKGKEQYKTFVGEVLQNGSRSLYDPITKNSFPLMSTPLKRMTTAGNKVKIIKLNSEIFSEAAAVLEHRTFPIEKIFNFEQHFFAPAISDFGELHLPKNKSDLVYTIVTPCHNPPAVGEAEFDPTSTIILDGLRLVTQFHPNPSMTFIDYVNYLSKNVISLFFVFNQRVDIVFETFLEKSLKASTCQKRGHGPRRSVSKLTKCPSNWAQFLKDSLFKEELYTFLAEELTPLTYPEGRQLYATSKENILSNGSLPMEDCDHEDADSRMLLHAKHAISQGMNKVRILSNDTDVVIIGLGVYHRLRASFHFEDIIIEFGLKKDHKAISLKSLAESLGELRCQALPFFHALTGSDTTSAFKSIGKKKAYEALKVCPNAESTFGFIFNNPFHNLAQDDAKFESIQRFTILMYHKTSMLTKVNEARKRFYFQRTKNIETIPPTEDALFLHTLRAIYQAGVWSKSLEIRQNLPSPQAFGWKHSNESNWTWEPKWISQYESSKEAREFVKCSCKSESCTRCKCSLASLKCTLLCTCKCADKERYE